MNKYDKLLAKYNELLVRQNELLQEQYALQKALGERYQKTVERGEEIIEAEKRFELVKDVIEMAKTVVSEQLLGWRLIIDFVSADKIDYQLRHRPSNTKESENGGLVEKRFYYFDENGEKVGPFENPNAIIAHLGLETEFEAYQENPTRGKGPLMFLKRFKKIKIEKELISTKSGGQSR